MSVLVVLSDKVELKIGVDGDAVWLDDTLYTDDQLSCSTIIVHFKSVEQARRIAEEILRLTLASKEE